MKEALEFCFDHWFKTGLLILWIGICFEGVSVIKIKIRDKT